MLHITFSCKYSRGKLFSLCALLSCGLVLLGGCAADLDKMVPSPVEITKKFPYSVSIQCSGGSYTNPVMPSQISCGDFAAALTDTINKTGLFKSVAANAYTSDYVLSITIRIFDKSLIGTEFKTRMETTWMLVNPRNEKILWNETFTTYDRVDIADTFTAEAKQEAVKTNIREGIRRLSEADI